MNKKLIAVLLILTILPVFLISWLWVVNVRSEKDRSQQQFALVAAERLKNIDFQIGDVFSQIEKELLQLPAIEDMSVDEIRQVTRTSPLIRQFFILDHDSSLQYPSPDMVLSLQEQEFLNRTKEIGLAVGLFQKPRDEESGDMEDRGWYTWYLGEGINFIYWRASTSGFRGEVAVVGMELNRMAVLSAVINGLPDTDLDSAAQYRVQLKDVGGGIVYQWGEGPEEQEFLEFAAVPVSPPLQSWTLHYLAPSGSGAAASGRLVPILSTLSVAVIFIISLAVYLYRESTREIREAMQRVTFVNQVSHELKTPLTNIRMYAELLDEQIQDEETQQKNYLSIIVSESRRLSRLIGNVLTFAREQRNGVQCNPEKLNADEVVRSVLENFAPTLREKGIQVAADLRCGMMSFIDRDMLEQILSNLISNVEKYGAAGKWMAVESGREGEKIILTVRDKGPGIPKNVREKVWKPFYRVSNKLVDGVSGTGIGLSIVRTLAEAHGGSAEVLSVREGAAVQVTLHAPEVES